MLAIICLFGFAGYASACENAACDNADFTSPTAKSLEPFNPSLFQKFSGKSPRSGGNTIAVNPLANSFPEKIVLYVTALDGRGNSLTGLKQSDFTVAEQSENEAAPTTETITDFTKDTAGGDRISFSLVFDLSGSMEGESLADAKEAANNFLLNANPLDRVALVTFSSGGSEKIVNPSDFVYIDADGDGAYDIIEAINRLDAGGRTAVYDGTAKGIEALTQEPQPKAVIVFTDGDTFADMSYTINSVIAKANNEGVPLYTIGLNIDPDNLKDMANATGGLYKYAPTAQDMADIYNDIAQSIRSQYQITYASHNPAFDGTTRTVTVDYKGTIGTGIYVVNSKPSLSLDAAVADLSNRSQDKGIALTISGTITDLDAHSPGQSLAGSLFYKHITDANFSQTPLTLTDLGSGIYSFSGYIPDTAVREPALQYYLYVTDGIQETYSPFNYSVTPYSVTVLPNVAPDIVHSAITSAAANNPVDVSAQITDSTAGDSVTTALLYYRIHDPNQETPYIAIPMTSADNITHTAQIPADSVTGAGVDYFISAWDSYNARRDDGSSQSPHFVQVASDQTIDGNDNGGNCDDNDDGCDGCFIQSSGDHSGPTVGLFCLAGLFSVLLTVPFIRNPLERKK